MNGPQFIRRDLAEKPTSATAASATQSVSAAVSEPQSAMVSSTKSTMQNPNADDANLSQTAIPTRSFVSRLRTVVPTLVVIALLAGVAAWGHSTDWKLPKFSALLSGGGEKDAANQCIEGESGWCKEHNVPEAECIECNAKLLAPLTDYGWCAEHGISQCTLEHPDIAQLKEAPEVSAADRDRASRALALLPRVENNSRCKHYQTRIQFASVAAIEKAGIDIAVVDRQHMVEAIAANGQVVYDELRTAHLASRVAGTVWRVEKQLGDEVHKGDVLALVESADVGRVKAELLQAISQLRVKQAVVDRLQPLARDGAIPGKQLQEAAAALEQAKLNLLGAEQVLVNLGLPTASDDWAALSIQQIAKKLQLLGVPETIAERLDETSVSSNLFPLRTPLDGVLVECKVVSGETVDTSTVNFVVSDVRRMWLVLDVRQEDANLLSLGQTVVFRSADRKEDAPRKGNIAWISTAADDKTRTVKVRVDLANTDGQLRANTFGAGQIVLRDEPEAIVVPNEAVHSDGDCKLVFVRDKDFFKEGSPKFFHVREVRLGAQDAANTEIIAGLLPGEVIACKNSVVLEAQLLKSNLGEGCACCAAAKKVEK
jgi:cobalt-zinc-cadmium efflux system membrane fusion protein